MSSKTIISLAAGLGTILGGFIPWVFGDHSMLDAWGILGGLVGGIVGVWVGVKVSKQLS